MAKKLGSSDDTNVVSINPNAEARRNQAEEVTSAMFLEAVREIAKVNAELRAINERRKGIRKQWKAEGIELGILDAALKMAEWDRTEVRAHFDTSRKYADWLGLPIGQQADLFAKSADDMAVLNAEWFGLGRVASRLGKANKAPDECPPECLQAWQAGFNEEDEAEWTASEIADAQTRAAAVIDPEKKGNIADIAKALAAKPAPKGTKAKPGTIGPDDLSDRDEDEQSGAEGDQPTVLN